MKVYTYNTSTYTDVSAEASSSSGSTFSIPGTAVNNAVYVASDLDAEWYGMRIDITVALVGGTCVWEYYDGSDWVEMVSMVTQTTGKILPLAKTSMEATGVYNIRFDRYPATWTKTDPMTLGTSYYWLRFRVSETITTAPTIEYITLHNTTMSLNDYAFFEYYGKARPCNLLGYDLNMARPTSNSPGRQDIYQSDHLGVGRNENNFSPDAHDILGMCQELPSDIDTSTPIKLVIRWFSDSSDTGNVYWIVRYAYTTPGATWYLSKDDAPTTAPTEVNTTATVANTGACEEIITKFNIDLSNTINRRDMSCGDMLILSIERDGTSELDTHTGNVSIIQISPHYFKWCEGGYQ